MGFQHWCYNCGGGKDMKALERLKAKKKSMLDQMQRGRVVTEQMRAERLRKKINKRIDMKPGVRQAIVHGLAMKKHPMDVMKGELSRRRFEREQKKKNKK